MATILRSRDSGTIMAPDREENEDVPLVEVRATRLVFRPVYVTPHSQESGWVLHADVGYPGRERAKGEPGLYEEVLAVGTSVERFDANRRNVLRGRGAYVVDRAATTALVERLCARRGWPSPFSARSSS